MRTSIASVIIVEHASRRRRGRVVGALHCGPAVRIAQIVDLALLQEGVVLVLVAAGGSAHSAATGSEVVFVFLKVVRRVRGEGGFALGCEGRVGDCIGEGSCASEVHHVAEGHEGCHGEENTTSALVLIILVIFVMVIWGFTYKMNTPMMVVASLSLHFDAFP